nr:STAS domain-containing protein [candidate division Zixibacteria bacterium]
MENIKISVSESGRDENISVIRVDGVIDTLTATQLEEVLDRLLNRNRYKIVLDLAGVDYISSAGWGIFISRIKEIRGHEGDIKLANMVANVMEIYELLEFDNILEAFDNANSARAAFGNSSGPQGPKKKAPLTGVRTTIEQLPSFSQAAPTARTAEFHAESRGGKSLTRAEQIVLDSVREDPFYTISELKLVLQESLLDSGIGWWGVFKILWGNNLLSRRARFRYARQHRNRN